MNQRVDLRLFIRHDSPDADAIVEPAANHKLAVRRKPHDVLFFERLAERVEADSRRDLPQLDRRIGARTGKEFSIRRKDEVKDRSVVSLESADFFAGFQIP